MDQDCRTSAFEALAGYSYGGLFCLYVLFTHPETLDAYFAGSPSLGDVDGVWFRLEEEHAQQHDDLPTSLFLTVGTQEEGLADLEELAGTLRERGYPRLHTDVCILEEGNHQTAIPQAWTEALLFLIGKYVGILSAGGPGHEEPRAQDAAPLVVYSPCGSRMVRLAKPSGAWRVRSRSMYSCNLSP